MQVFTNDASGTKRDDHLSDLRFSTLSLPDKLLQGIADAGFRKCTHIQEKTLPIALTGGDVAGQAPTGTGKTATLLVAFLKKLANSDPTH